MLYRLPGLAFVVLFTGEPVRVKYLEFRVIYNKMEPVYKATSLC